MKGITPIMVMYTVVSFFAIGALKVSNTEHSVLIIKAGKVIKHLQEQNKKDLQYGFDQAAINIILINNMSERNQMMLLQDSVYLELTGKIY